MFLLRFCYATAALAAGFCSVVSTLLQRLSFPRPFCYDPTTTMKIRLRLDAAATLLRLRPQRYA